MVSPAQPAAPATAAIADRERAKHTIMSFSTVQLMYRAADGAADTLCRCTHEMLRLCCAPAGPVRAAQWQAAAPGAEAAGRTDHPTRVCCSAIPHAVFGTAAVLRCTAHFSPALAPHSCMDVHGGNVCAIWLHAIQLLLGAFSAAAHLVTANYGTRLHAGMSTS
jgi:hypothetical protein